ncbi:protein ARABIDOPSIS THALIANA ANTHER 7-like [Salvia miltiorrhiza]|uniref:protein ARABIDOPSIS THALIANA ANTHER 7-like n=1 Tax=Salvia miltiorrhiza TaxID=226208 RepID=UPI0025AD31CD|nr:protein ARABIDOPSIS THALIANA ANTHER 7-like [Salvia miltiorrhiza]
MSPLVFLLTLALSFSRPITAWHCKGCKDVFDNFSQCAGFIEGQGINPTPTCCQSIRNLNAIAKQEMGGSIRICKCIEYFATYKARHPFVTSRIHDLPLKCNERLSFPISEHMNCYRIV